MSSRTSPISSSRVATCDSTVSTVSRTAETSSRRSVRSVAAAERRRRRPPAATRASRVPLELVEHVVGGAVVVEEVGEGVAVREEVLDLRLEAADADVDALGRAEVQFLAEEFEVLVGHVACADFVRERGRHAVEFARVLGHRFGDGRRLGGRRTDGRRARLLGGLDGFVRSVRVGRLAGRFDRRIGGGRLGGRRVRIGRALLASRHSGHRLRVDTPGAGGSSSSPPPRSGSSSSPGNP
ncbi:hypothetical protein ACFQJD_07220 [Haloplanus sp. GCM10025708]|uniref:hypothetical protein n=1 Tax=Haloplanus sp. GCM10025708 TaxID=3252679 RepID=UPI00361CCCAE